jgi:anti-sigma-K factor RskA
MNEEHRQVLELLSAYAIDALDPEERDTVELHLQDCLDCQLILEEYQQIEQGLLHATKPQKPPASVRANLITKLAPTPESRTWIQRLTQSSLLRLGAIGAVVALLILNIGLYAQTRDLQEEIESLAAQQQSSQTGLALATYPDTQVVLISGDSIGGTFVYDPGVKVAVAYIWGLEQLPSEKTYQAWLVSPDGERTSSGLVQPEAGTDFTVLVVDSPLPLSEFVGFGMTIEPKGGSSGPTGPKVLGAEF